REMGNVKIANGKITLCAENGKAITFVYNWENRRTAFVWLGVPGRHYAEGQVTRNAQRYINSAPVSPIANKRYRLSTLCAESDFPVCNFYTSAFSEILKV
ncbi:MAG: hypothetical protein SO001_04235, partial [Alloprevotella sp.]|nr:hypothetical protein [Alloprevotella sp.]